MAARNWQQSEGPVASLHSYHAIRHLSGTPGGDYASEQNGRRVRQKTPQATQVIEHKGKQITVYKGTHAAEDTRWVLILDG